MKNRGERRYAWGEGWLIAAALGIMLALSLVLGVARMPEKMHVQPVHAVDAARLKRAEMVNINAAGMDELCILPGIGEGTAQRILKYRAANGPFVGIEDIMNVPGIGEGKFEAVRELIYAE